MDKKLRVWWVPQVPMKAFRVDVASVEEGVKILDTLAEYDLFQFENNVKPDYCNAGGLEMLDENADGEGNPGWVGWEHEEDDFYTDNPHEYVERYRCAC